VRDACGAQPLDGVAFAENSAGYELAEVDGGAEQRRVPSARPGEADAFGLGSHGRTADEGQDAPGSARRDGSGSIRPVRSWDQQIITTR
jgi:hypothetical protein